MIRVIQGTSGLDREMIQQMVNENKEALLTAQTNLADSEKKLKEIEKQNQKAERNCSDAHRRIKAPQRIPVGIKYSAIPMAFDGIRMAPNR